MVSETAGRVNTNGGGPFGLGLGRAPFSSLPLFTARVGGTNEASRGAWPQQGGLLSRPLPSPWRFCAG